MKDPLVAIIILNWNGWSDTVECLESIYHIDYTNYQIIVVDNNSSDDSIEKINDYTMGKVAVKSNFFNYDPNNKPSKISIYNKDGFNCKKTNAYYHKLFLIKNEKNYGYAEGNNIGIEYALKNLNPNYILLLNNDTVVDKDFLNILVKEGENDNKIGLLGPKIYYYDNPNLIWSVGGKIDWKLARGLHIGINEEDTGQYNKKEIFDYINGSALLIKREVIKDTGLLDKQFFLYFEETDFALRASKNGYKCLYIPHSKIWHKISKSGGGIKSEIGLYYITRNRWLFMKKWAHNNDFIIFVLLQILGILIIPSFLSVNNRKNLFIAYYRGFYDGIRQKT